MHLLCPVFWGKMFEQKDQEQKSYLMNMQTCGSFCKILSQKQIPLPPPTMYQTTGPDITAKVRRRKRGKEVQIYVTSELCDWIFNLFYVVQFVGFFFLTPPIVYILTKCFFVMLLVELFFIYSFNHYNIIQ